jgi:hypothetical protein
VATTMTPFLREIKNAFNRPFIQVHSSYAAVGITLATLHPVAYAIQTSNASLFLPNFSLGTYSGRQQAGKCSSSSTLPWLLC